MQRLFNDLAYRAQRGVVSKQAQEHIDTLAFYRSHSSDNVHLVFNLLNTRPLHFLRTEGFSRGPVKPADSAGYSADKGFVNLLSGEYNALAEHLKKKYAIVLTLYEHLPKKPPSLGLRKG